MDSNTGHSSASMSRRELMAAKKEPNRDLAWRVKLANKDARSISHEPAEHSLYGLGRSWTHVRRHSEHMSMIFWDLFEINRANALMAEINIKQAVGSGRPQRHM